MKVLAIVGSPRRGGNTDLLVDRVLKAATDQGAKVEKIYPGDMKIAPCIDCRACKKGDYECVVQDDMQAVYPKIRAADALVFGTPLYWWGPSAQIKPLIDRMRPFVGKPEAYPLSGKKAAVVCPSGDETGQSTHLVAMFRSAFAYLKMDYVDSVLAQAYDKGEVAKDPSAMALAEALGKRLAG